MHHRYLVGSKVKVTVRRILPIGLSVQLANGEMGLIRVRELSWKRRERANWAERFAVGDKLTAVMLGEKSGDALALSLRLASDDPWLDAPANYRPGQLVAGVVSGVQPYGVFVELEPTVTGLVHRSQLPGWAAERIDDLFWPGDDVRVVIKSIDPERRRISLGMATLMEHRWRDSSIPDTAESSPSTPPAHGESRSGQLPQLPLQILTHQQPMMILLVEDDARQRNALDAWLKNAGQRVEMAGAAEKALAVVDDVQPDIVLMDVGLPGMDGIAAIQQIRTRLPAARLYLMTDWARANEREEELAELLTTGIGLLLKPLLPEDLLDVLQKVKEPEEPNSEVVDPAPGAATQATSDQQPPSPKMTDDRPVLHISIEDTLRQVRRLTRAATAVLFSVDSARGQTQIIAQSGRHTLNRDALINLHFSPVRDAAEEGETVRIHDAEQASDYARHLLPLLTFQSCLGLPVRTHLTRRHALFLFYDRPLPSGRQTDAYAKSGSLALGALLESRLVLERTMEMQQLALLGHLTRALVHELNHQLSPVSFSLSSLTDQCNVVERLALQASDGLEREILLARETLTDLSQGVRNLVKMSRLFGQLTVRDHEERVLVRRVLEKSIIFLEDMSDRAHVQIHLAPENPWLITYARETHLQQMFLNLLLNAIQQIELIRPQQGGKIRVSIEKSDRIQPEMVLVHIEDDGPGLHQRLWERVFDLGYTTRPAEGSGLGLYITRQLATHMGGRVSVTESAVLWGTRFTVELPTAF